MERYTGVVIWFSNKKGFGFIEVDGDAEDFFVHWCNVNNDVNGFKTLKKDQRVSFAIGTNKKGQQAIDVDVIDDITTDIEVDTTTYVE